MQKDKQGKLTLSSSVLQLKFMHRSKKRYTAEAEAGEARSIHGEQITKEMIEAKEKYVKVDSFVPLMNLIVGRVSYGGINPDIEKLMPQNQEEKEFIPPAIESDVSEWEMLKLSNVAKTMANKFNRKKGLKRAREED